MIISGSEDGNVYLWDREPAAQPSTLASGPSLVHLASHQVDDKSSPAYYPAKAQRPLGPVGHGAGINVRPLKVLEGHGDGAVFDVRWRDGDLISSGEDGSVIVWTTSEEEEEKE